MNVRAQSLLNAAKWLQEQHGNDALVKVLKKCSPQTRERYTSALPIEWHPQEELIEFIAAIEETIGDGSGQTCIQIGASTARLNLGGFVKKTVFYLANREYLFRRVTAFWRQFNDAGELKVLEYDDRKAMLELVGLSNPNRYFCGLITGWSLEVSKTLGINNPQSRHSSCQGKHDDRCLWDIEWPGYSLDEAKLKRSQEVWKSPPPPSQRRR